VSNLTEEEFLQGIPEDLVMKPEDNTNDAGGMMPDEIYQEYVRKLRDPETTPEDLSNWWANTGIGSGGPMTNAQTILDRVRANPDIEIPRAWTQTHPGRVEHIPDANNLSVYQAPTESWGHAIRSSIADSLTGVSRGYDNVQNQTMGLLTRGTDAVGLTTGSHDRYNRIMNEVVRPRVDSEYQHPDGWSRTAGEIAGESVALAPLLEIRAAQALGRGAPTAIRVANRFADYGIQGALAGTAMSGGDNIVEHAGMGAAGGILLGGAFEALSVPARFVITRLKVTRMEQQNKMLSILS